MRRPTNASRRPSICIVRHSYYPDGHVRRDAETLVQAGYDVTVIALRQRDQPRRETLHGVNVHRLPVGRSRGSILQYVWEYLAFAVLAMLTVGRLHLRKGFHAIEVDNMPDILVFSALVPKLTGTPVILYIFDNMPELFSTIRKVSHRHPVVILLAVMERISTAFADQVIVTQDMARQLVISRGVRPDKVHVVLNCPDEAIFPLAPPRVVRERGATFEIVTHGAILERFGIQVLVTVLPAIARSIPGVSLHIYGDGGYRKDLEELARRTGVAERVHFHGFVPLEAIPGYLQRADVGYVGMLCDFMLSNKLMEYTALRVPAIVARWPTYEHYFPDDAVTYFRAGDTADLTRAVLDVYRDPVEAAARVNRSAANYQHYRWTVQREMYLGVYRQFRTRTRRAEQPAIDYAVDSTT